MGTLEVEEILGEEEKEVEELIMKEVGLDIEVEEEQIITTIIEATEKITGKGDHEEILEEMMMVQENMVRASQGEEDMKAKNTAINCKTQMIQTFTERQMMVIKRKMMVSLTNSRLVMSTEEAEVVETEEAIIEAVQIEEDPMIDPTRAEDEDELRTQQLAELAKKSVTKKHLEKFHHRILNSIMNKRKEIEKMIDHINLTKKIEIVTESLEKE